MIYSDLTSFTVGTSAILRIRPEVYVNLVPWPPTTHNALAGHNPTKWRNAELLINDSTRFSGVF